MVSHFAVATLFPVPAGPIKAIRRAAFGMRRAALSQAARSAAPSLRQASWLVGSEAEGGMACWRARAAVEPRPRLLISSEVPDSGAARRAFAGAALRRVGVAAGAWAQASISIAPQIRPTPAEGTRLSCTTMAAGPRVSCTRASASSAVCPLKSISPPWGVRE